MSGVISNGTDYRAVYLKHIESCYRYHPEAFSFYDQLADYLQQRSGTGRQRSTLQEVKFFEITPLASSATYPVAFPLHRIEIHDQQHRPRVGVLEGYPDPDCIAFLGAEFAVRPEFFIEHLPMSLKRGVNARVHELPTVPSRQDNVVRVPFSRLVKSLAPYPDSSATQTSSFMYRKRNEVEEARVNYEKGLVKYEKYGAAHIRRIIVHDREMCSIEEMVSFAIATHGNQWCGIFLTDNGRMLMDQEGLPWTKSPRNDQLNWIVPLIPYNLLAERATRVPISGRDDSGLSGSLDQFHPLKNIVIADEVDGQLMQEDPFFLLASVLTVSFLSWSQTLNSIAQSIRESQDQLQVDQRTLQFQLEQLRQHFVTISRVKECLSENEHIIAQGGCPSWPKAATNATVQRRGLIQRQLKADYARMMERCSHLISQCESATSILVGFAQLVVSEKGTASAHEVNQLTRMAAIFIPLTLITGIFGMNVREWDPSPSWRWPFGCAIVVFCLTIFILSGHRIRRFTRLHHIPRFTRSQK
ncbi:cora-like Mg2+ transporter protein-domain-containing protein [Aspergillus oleicola]